MIVDKYPGTFVIHHDTAVYGKMKKDHNASLFNHMAMTAKRSLKCNSPKCQIKTNIKFYGCQFKNIGNMRNPTEIQGISDMPVSKYITTLQSLLGICNFLSLIPHMSHHKITMRTLLQKAESINKVFTWSKP